MYLEVGDVVLYEPNSVVRGWPLPLNGNAYAVLHFHYIRSAAASNISNADADSTVVDSVDKGAEL
jgi:hypothetical protein